MSASPPSSEADEADIDQLPPPTPPSKFAFLQSLTSTAQHGSTKTFYQHLFNVYTYLKSRNAPAEVCDAGLFHSIYGTEFYKFHSEQITRDVVRGFIGTYAEELVHVFCTSRDRFHVIVENRLGLSEKQVRDLCCVEFANMWDQNKGGKYREQMLKLGEVVSRIESGGKLEMPPELEESGA